MTMTPPEPLPGLELPEPKATESALERAVRATLAELTQQGHVTGVDAGKVQLALEMAQVITVKRQSGRASTVGNDARVLMEILDAFVGEASDVDGELENAMTEWTAAIAAGLLPQPAPE